MRVQVVRVGASGGESFAEVQFSPDGQHLSGLRYSVPVSGDVKVGTILEVEVKVVETPQQAAAEQREPAIISHMNVEPLQVPTSPIVEGTDAEVVNTAPSGQSEAIPPTAPSEPELVRESLSGENVADDDSGGGEEKKGRLPEDFPAHAALEAEGVTTYAKLRKRIEDGTLTDINGIGEATAAKIEEALNE